MPNLLNWLIVIAGVILTTVVLFLDEFEKDSIGLLYLVIINFTTVGVVYLLTPKKNKFCKFTIFIAVFVVHILLLNNVSGWNEGSMSGATYIIPFLKNATDVLYALLLFSAFFLLIPLGIYGLFIFSLVSLFCKNSTSCKNTDSGHEKKNGDLLENK